MTGSNVRGRSWIAAAACVLALNACDDGAPAEDRVTTVEVVSGDDQTQTVGAQLAQPLVVRALDSEGRPVGGARVEWLVAEPPGGSVSPQSTVTDAEGRASAQWTLGTSAVVQSVSVLVGTASVTLNATATPGPAVEVTVTPAPVVLDAIDATAQLTATGADTHENPIAGRATSWTSTDTDIVTVDASGVVRAIAPGQATVRATIDGATGEVGVTVQPQAAAVGVDPVSAQLTAIGQTIQLTASAVDRTGHPVSVPAGSFAWSSLQPTIVAVDQTGLATAVGAGVAEVRAALGALTGQALIGVTQAAATLAVSPKTDTLTTAQPTVQLVVTAQDANGQPIPAPAVMWSTSNAAIASVSANGVVTAIGNGVATIRARSGSAVDSATITVRLNARPGAVADLRATAVNMSLAVAAPGLLANDTLGIPSGTIVGFGGGTLGGASTTVPAGSTVTFGTGGSLTVNADGSLTFVPSTGFTGTFTFLYRVQNVAGFSDGAVTIEVGGLPVAADDAYATTVNAPLVVPAFTGVLANDDRATPAANVLSFGGGVLGGDATTYTAGQTVAFGTAGFAGGVVQLRADGSFSFTPPTGFTGTITFRYRMGNALASSDATVTITVN